MTRAEQEHMLREWIERRRARTGSHNGIIGFGSKNVGPLRPVVPPTWLVDGATIQLETSVLDVLVVNPEMCLVRGREFTHAVETELLVLHWWPIGETER